MSDKTGLTGIFEFTLEYTGAPVPVSAADSTTEVRAPIAKDPAEDVPGIFVALERQLGLGLVKVKDVPVDVLVIDQADKVPSAN